MSRRRRGAPGGAVRHPSPRPGQGAAGRRAAGRGEGIHRSGGTGFRRRTGKGRPGATRCWSRPRSTSWPGRHGPRGRPRRRAARNYAAAGYQRGVLAARVMEARAESVVRARPEAAAPAAGRPGRSRRRCAGTGPDRRRSPRGRQGRQVAAGGGAAGGRRRPRRGGGRCGGRRARRRGRTGESVATGAADRHRAAHQGGGRADRPGARSSEPPVWRTSVGGWTIWPRIRPGSARRICSPRPRCTVAN